MSKSVIIKANDGEVGDRVRAKIAEYGDRFVPVTEQNNTILVMTLDGKQGLAFNKREADWEIVED